MLFIDEAYALTDSGSENDFGPLVIAELIRAMINHADKLMVIAAGYADKMQEFLDSNDGLRSRFTRSITLPSYTVDELVEITTLKATKGGSIIEDVEPLRRPTPTWLAPPPWIPPGAAGRRSTCSATADSPTTSSGSPRRNAITASTSPASSGRTPRPKICRPSPVRIYVPR